jgi:hypothetical protein
MQKAHAARKIALGLVDDLLPALAFNTLSGTLYPFPTHMQLSQRNIKEHVEGFLSGRLLVSVSYYCMRPAATSV